MTRSRPILEGDGTSERIRAAGISLFRARGYHGTSVRALAELVGVEAASLYHYYPSKQELLCGIFDRVMDDFLAGLEQALGSAADFDERLRSFVRFHVTFHVERQDEAFVSHSELRSLTGPNRRRINAKRDHYEAMLRAFLGEGVKAGAFDIPDVRLTTIAILMMCSGVSDWFEERGRLSADTVVEAYIDMVLRLTRPAGDAPRGKKLPDRRPASGSTSRRHRAGNRQSRAHA
jgi:AcrR family transcriptional regulator